MAILEVMIPMGGMVGWGALGITFRLTDGHLLAVEVVSCAGRGDPWNGALVAGFDQAFAGIPQWAESPVLDSAAVALAGAPLGSGSLRFDRGAYGTVGSSPFVFRCLAWALVHLARFAAETADEATLAGLIERAIESAREQSREDCG